MAASGAGCVAGVVVMARRRGRIAEKGRAYGVVINRPREELCSDGSQLTPPLANLTEHARITVTPTAEGRGSQVLAVTHERSFDVRGALRSAKQIVETGEVLRAPLEPAARGPVGTWLTRYGDRMLSSGGW